MTDEDERANRMAQKRRKHEQRKQRQQTEADEAHKTDKTNKSSEPDKSGKSDKSKDEEPVGTYMYLPPSLKDDLGYRYQELKLELSREFDVPMDNVEKNAHFYPAVIKHGLENLTAEHVYAEIGN
jgi:hypothetical protein